MIEETGWGALPRLESEGDYERIKQELARFLETQHAGKLFTSAAYEQARGQTPASFY